MSRFPLTKKSRPAPTPTSFDLLSKLLSGGNVDALFQAATLAHAHLQAQAEVDSRDTWEDGTKYPEPEDEAS